MSATEGLVLAIDVGTSVVRAGLVSQTSLNTRTALLNASLNLATWNSGVSERLCTDRH